MLYAREVNPLILIHRENQDASCLIKLVKGFIKFVSILLRVRWLCDFALNKSEEGFASEKSSDGWLLGGVIRIIERGDRSERGGV